jgi:hypothetical protein
MPRRIFLPREGTLYSSGIDITWTPSAQRLDFSGWYDSFVGIEGDSFTLLEFFNAMGITEKDCNRAWNTLRDRRNKRRNNDEPHKTQRQGE